MTDREILRVLALEYRACFDASGYDARLKLHRAVNDLRMIRPVVLLDELPWHRLNFDGSLTLTCAGEYERGMEHWLRRRIFQYKHFPGDMLLTPYMPAMKVIHDTGLGISIDENRLSQNDGNHIVAHEYHDVLKDEDSLKLLKNSVITYDAAATQTNADKLNELIGDILPARITGYGAYHAIWDTISMLRGVGPLFMDLIDRPEYTHAMMARFMEIVMDQIDQYEALNLYEPHPTSLHCTAAEVTDLPLAGFDDNHVTARDVWGRGMAQVFASVSPAMHEEFDIRYTGAILNRFGLSYYGCCEPLDNKIDILAGIKNLRKVSITPWANVEVAAEWIGKKYVLAAKPNPAFVAEDTFDAARVRKEIERALSAAQKHGCATEFTLKDISHCGRAENIFEWEKVAMAVVKG